LGVPEKTVIPDTFTFVVLGLDPRTSERNVAPKARLIVYEILVSRFARTRMTTGGWVVVSGVEPEDDDKRS
jgi:hypothetical protein